jgi:hypothetical protein
MDLQLLDALRGAGWEITHACVAGRQHSRVAGCINAESAAGIAVIASSIAANGMACKQKEPDCEIAWFTAGLRNEFSHLHAILTSSPVKGS